jgi:spermidine synthase
MIMVSFVTWNQLMLEQLQKKYAPATDQKLYEKETPLGLLVVYQTTLFGLLLTLNGEPILSESDGFFYHEMMAHSALFAHPHPQTVVVTGYYHGILQEILKHPDIKTIWCISTCSTFDDVITRYFSDLKHPQDSRIQLHLADSSEWLKQQQASSIDVLIQASTGIVDHYADYFQVLNENGILIQACSTSLMDFKTFKPIFQNIQQAGFYDWQTLHFPQPSYSSGSRTLLMTHKSSAAKRIRERDIYNRNFATRYYNFDTHKAALALPEFIRKEWEI